MLPLFRNDGLSRFKLFGERTYLRPPSRTDSTQWTAVRERSRGVLEPWEPAW